MELSAILTPAPEGGYVAFKPETRMTCSIWDKLVWFDGFRCALPILHATCLRRSNAVFWFQPQPFAGKEK